MRAGGVHPRQVNTPAGELSYKRTVWECPKCRKSTAPLDGELGVESGEKMSRSLIRKVAWSVAQASFMDAAANVKELLGIEVSPAECHRVGLQVGARVEELQRESEAERLAPVSPENPAPPAEIEAERLVIGADAAAVLRRTAEGNKMVWCGRAFALEDRGRQGGEEGNARPFITVSRHAGGSESWEDFGPRLKALGYRMGMRTAALVAFVGDGAACLWKWALENLPPGTVLIQDFWHVCEHLAEVCREVYGEDSQTSERLARWRQALAESRVREIIEELRGEHNKRRGGKRELLRKEIGYLENGAERMDYARYRAEGWLIGSGAIEADCKHLIKQRFNLTGARWTQDNIGPILALRVAIFNDEWDAFWLRN